MPSFPPRFRPVRRCSSILSFRNWSRRRCWHSDGSMAWLPACRSRPCSSILTSGKKRCFLRKSKGLNPASMTSCVSRTMRYRGFLWMTSRYDPDRHRLPPASRETRHRAGNHGKQLRPALCVPSVSRHSERRHRTPRGLRVASRARRPDRFPNVAEMSIGQKSERGPAPVPSCAFRSRCFQLELNPALALIPKDYPA